ncbi:Asp23/Gls24 family envelope stress response protein [Sinanaerobacter sp. ZZT-01]|uniref:Asp23/Gls24 family envelope stress response protein n=1 Tax=Sinanaerobacter sp. ZZT-01 TaxID=3111540 RepID=UPI002D7740D2|nr:Asp23/Gls24 family envelope stress response protein [Sinanaerobacter sp. ZZT-01]WRR93129.1 Asp23/Gls24 family envelope stress response protein [Sinanaerobacter sp. ZZT-01]
MGTINDEKYGMIKISDEVIAVCAMNATLKTEGVSALSRGITDSISNMLGKEPLYKGIKVAQTDYGIVIDIYPIVFLGVKIPEVAFNIQKSVKKEVEHMLDETVKAVNIHVQGIDVKQNENKTHSS